MPRSTARQRGKANQSCSYQRIEGPLCGRASTEPDGLCIFHSPGASKSAEAFSAAISDQLGRQDFDFHGYVFPGDVSFRSVQIRDADFRQATFENEARFLQITFYGHALFDRAQFTGDALFRGAQFAGPAQFVGAQFAGPAQFEGAQFIGDAWFQGAQFTGDAWFEGAQFNGIAGFEGATFAGNAGFMGAQFAGNARFEGAQFTGYARFEGAQFSRFAWFGGAQFSRFARFLWAQFTGDARFDDARFCSDARFFGARWERSPRFLRTHFERAADFSGVRLAEPTTFDQVRFGRESTFARTDLSQVTFRRCRMGNVALTEAYGLGSAEFDEVTWGMSWQRGPLLTPRLPGSPPFVHQISRVLVRALPCPALKRDVVVEDRAARRARNPAEYATAARVYRELRGSHEDHRHYAAANRMAYREMEVRRLALGLESRKPWWAWLRRNVLSLEAWYLHLSNHGESALKPLLWLIAVVFLLCPWLYGAFGLAVAGTHLVWADPPLFEFSLRTAALLPDPQSYNFGLGTQVVQVFERIIGPFLAILFTLAIRRRFRR